jgi:hypothetical protein
VLTHGRESRYATYFDIDWTLDPDGRIVLPVLGSDDDVDALTVDGDVLRLDAREWPIAPGTGSGSGSQVHDRQHYRLVGWRHNVCGYRRFFSITQLHSRPAGRDDATPGRQRWQEVLFDVFASIIRMAFESRGLLQGGRANSSGWTVDRDREDPRGRRIAGADAARRRHHRL